MKILIAGAGGFVGGALLERLAAHELILPSREPEKFRRAGVKGSFPVFNEDLEKLARFIPVFAVPSDAFVAPVETEAVAACFARAAEDASIKNELFELAGDRVINFRRLVSETLEAAGFRRLVIGLPRKFFFPLLPLFELFPEPPMTREQYLMMASPNTPSGRYRGVKDLLKN